MTALEAIAELDSLLPNSYTQEQKLRWLDRLDAFLQVSVLDRYPGRTGDFAGGDVDRGLLMPEPFSEAYVHWLESKVHYCNQEIDRYNEAMGMFRGLLEDYQRELHRREALKKDQDFKM